MAKLMITRHAEMVFHVDSGSNHYHVTKMSGRWSCDCPARGVCKHIRTVLSCFGMGVGDTVQRTANTNKSNGDDGLLSPEDFDAEAGRDVISELNYIRSGREKRNMGC